jgi:hypothetical protein
MTLRDEMCDRVIGCVHWRVLVFVGLLRLLLASFFVPAPVFKRSLERAGKLEEISSLEINRNISSSVPSSPQNIWQRKSPAMRGGIQSQTMMVG